MLATGSAGELDLSTPKMGKVCQPLLELSNFLQYQSCTHAPKPSHFCLLFSPTIRGTTIRGTTTPPALWTPRQSPSQASPKFEHKRVIWTPSRYQTSGLWDHGLPFGPTGRKTTLDAPRTRDNAQRHSVLQCCTESRFGLSTRM